MRKLSLEHMISKVENNIHTKLLCDNCGEHISKHRLVGLDAYCSNTIKSTFYSKLLDNESY